jgi:hypothetical protein
MSAVPLTEHSQYQKSGDLRFESAEWHVPWIRNIRMILSYWQYIISEYLELKHDAAPVAASVKLYISNNITSRVRRYSKVLSCSSC